MIADYECDMRHGGPYDRGSADAYYERNPIPHYYIGETYSSKMVAHADMTEREIEEYNLGYNEQKDSGVTKYNHD